MDGRKRGALAQLTTPPNRIPPQCQTITPEMLPLIDLDREQIDRIIRWIPGGARNIQDIYPLAPLQEGILFHHRLGSTDVYVRPVLLEFADRPRLDAFVDGLQQVIDRHDILRSAILWDELPRPVQVVQRHAALPLQTVVLNPDQDPMSQVEQWVSFERQRLDLRSAPLLRLQVAANPQGSQWYGLLRLHHVVCDNESVAMMWNEIGTCIAGRAQELPEPMPYRDHVAQSLESARMRAAEEFFRRKLGDIDEPTAPFGFVDVHGDGSQIDEARRPLEPTFASRVRIQARRSYVSVATLFHAAWSLVLAHTSGRDRVVFGTVLFGRMQVSGKARQRFGMFLNTLPLGLQLQGMTVKQLVAQTQKELHELLGHEQASLAMAQRCSGIVGSAPLFTTLLNYRHSPVKQGPWGWDSIVGVRQLAGPDRTSYPITVSIDDIGEGFKLTVQSDRRIDPQRVAAYLQTALQSVVEALEHSPHTAALTLSILPESERQLLLESFNATNVEYPRDKAIYELFEQQVERSPDAIAVTYDGYSLTYAELNRRANQLARYLRDKGVGPDRLVGICVERSLEMVVGLLGILKAGGAYVPLDPGHPPERLTYMLADAAPQVVLTQKHVKELLPQTTAEVVLLDQQWSDIAQQPDTHPDASGSDPELRHLAYVIYTSGSTGKPKGAMNEHRGVVNRLLWMQDRYQLGPRDRVLQKTPFSFDVSVWEFFWTLISGARLVMARPEGHKDPQYLRQLIETAGITTLHFVPSMLQIFLEHIHTGDCSSLRHVVCSGEELPLALQKTCFERLPAARLSNLYGPTEAAVDVTAWECRESGGETKVPIGRPIANLRMYVLDELRQPVPLQVVGELYIGGIGVGRGYLGRPDLTAERFVADPFSAVPGAHLYKTGDLGRWRPDGAIEYLGRNDFQVKIRGFRIELGEIEARLTEFDGIKEAVVLAREERPGEKRLVAYVTVAKPGESAAAATVEELRTYMKKVLPEHMVPSAYVLLEQLPLSSNGKLDRRALPAPDLDAFVRRRYEAPQGELEEVLAGVWQELLRVQRVGRHDNFFELGGHSLLIMQMMERLRRLGWSAEIRRVFESGSLAELASALTRDLVPPIAVPPNLIPPGCEAITPQMLPLVELERAHIERIVEAVPGGAANIQDIYPLAPLQEGLLFHHLLGGQSGDAYVLSVMFSVSSRERLDKLIAALQSVIDRHDILRTAVLWEALPRPIQVVCRQTRLPVEAVALDRDRDSMQQLRQWLRPERQRLDLRQAPLMQLQIAPDPHDDQWYALWKMHHITCDHVTMETIISEVSAHLRGCAQQLPKSEPYRSHVAHALAYTRTREAENFFRRKLAQVNEPTAPFGLLEVHRSGGAIEEAHEDLHTSLAQRVRTQARQLGVTAATLFHAAWALVIAQTAGREDVVFGSVLLGRLQGIAAGEQILGMFINTLPLRLTLRGVSVKELVEHTQRELVELVSHEQASLAIAQRCSDIGGSAPLFTALLNYRHSTSGAQGLWNSMSGIKVLTIQERTSYPIVLAVDDTGEGFGLTAQTDRRIDPGRITAYLRTAVCSLVSALEQAPRTQVLSLSILPDEERIRVLEKFNGARGLCPQERLIHELFEERVKRTPQAQAVSYDGESFSYEELNARANHLGWYLRQLGIGPGDLVGICVERSLEMMVGLLGILKSGGAYVPLDPGYPPERLQYMLEDAQPKVLLTQQRLRNRLPELSAKIIALDDHWEQIAQYTGKDLERLTGENSHQLAYVIYTSGSTGKPKGVMIEHRSVLNHWQALEHLYRKPTDCRRIGVNAPFTFDASVQQWIQLLSGCTLFLIPQALRLDADLLLNFLDSNEITGVDCTPSQLSAWVAAGLLERKTGRPRTVLVGGEAIDPALWRRLARCREITFYNVYGPTECTVDSTGAYVPEDPEAPNIGRPLQNTRVYILDAHLCPVPVGVTGEIYIGGPGVARGYLKREDLTKEKFLADPYSAEPQARLYKSGDLGRWRTDGTIEYLGRNDLQVKIRGFRIELGEIEFQLAQHPRVQEAIVVAREDAPGDRRLVAYVTHRKVIDDNPAPGSEELRAYLRATLPDHMIPSICVAVDRFPVTLNGKVDRRALPAPEFERHAGRQHEAPQGRIEEFLATVWSEVLNVQHIGRHDNFFELGGHSLLGMKLVTRISEALGVRPPVATVFQYPTIGQMTQLVEKLVSEDAGRLEASPIALEEGIL